MRRLLSESQGTRFFTQSSGESTEAGVGSESKVGPAMHRSSKKRDLVEYILWGFVILLIIIVGGGIGIYFLKPELLPWHQGAPSSATKENQGSGKKSGYVAVFLSNNQVYFGKVSNIHDQYPLLRDIFYLRTQRALVPPDAGESSPGARLRVERRGTTPPEQNDRLTLLKLGNELHGPVDEIKLNRDHILYIEEIRDDSKVYQAIVKYQTQRE